MKFSREQSRHEDAAKQQPMFGNENFDFGEPADCFDYFCKFPWISNKASRLARAQTSGHCDESLPWRDDSEDPFLSIQVVRDAAILR
jgi:hypothetical protein